MSLPADEQQRLDALKRFFVLDHEVSEDELTRLVRVTAQLYGVAYAALTLREGEAETVKVAYGFDPAALPADAVLCERPVGPNLPLAVADASADARFARNPLVHGEAKVRFYASVPLKSSEGFTLGTLAIMDPAAQELNGEGLAMLVDLGALVEPSLNLIRARAERDAAQASLQQATAGLQQSQARLQDAAVRAARRDALADVALTVAARPADDEDARNEALGRVAVAAGATRAALFVVSDDGPAVCAAAWHTADAAPLFAPSETLALRVATPAVATGGGIPDALAGRDFRHLAALPSPRHDGFALLDGPAAWPEADLPAIRAALLPLFASSAEADGHEADGHGWMAAVEDAPVPIVFVAGLAGELLFANAHARDLLDLGDTLRDDRRLTTFAAPSDTAALAAFLAAAPHDAPPPTDVRLVDTSGAERHVRLFAAPVAFDGQTAVQIVLHDVSAHRREVAAMQTELDRAEAVARSKSAFLASMSHEIRSTLTAILGFAEILTDEAEGGQREMADTILHSSERLLQTLNSVMDMARLEAGDNTPQLEAVDVMPIVEAATADFQRRADARDLAFFVEGTGIDAIAWADTGALARVLDNLLSNAFKFTDQGGVRLRVAAEDDWVCLEVQDTGVGIDPEFLPHLFHEFRREESERDRNGQGSGLGLAITKRLVELMGGQITVTSLKGQGSVFRVILRAAPADAPPQRRAAMPPAETAFSGGDGMAAGNVPAP